MHTSFTFSFSWNLHWSAFLISGCQFEILLGSYYNCINTVNVLNTKQMLNKLEFRKSENSLVLLSDKVIQKLCSCSKKANVIPLSFPVFVKLQTYTMFLQWLSLNTRYIPWRYSTCFKLPLIIQNLSLISFHVEGVLHSNIYDMFRVKQTKYNDQRQGRNTRKTGKTVGNIECIEGTVIDTMKFQIRNYFSRKCGRHPFLKFGQLINLLFNI